MKTKPCKDKLFKAMPEHVRKLRTSAHTQARLRDRRQWKAERDKRNDLY